MTTKQEIRLEKRDNDMELAEKRAMRASAAPSAPAFFFLWVMGVYKLDLTKRKTLERREMAASL